jgi:tetratricopeptide (TPR) repeat protein
MIKINRFAALAYLYQDRAVAKRALERVGENWEISAWGKRSTFDQARAWAQPDPRAGGAAVPWAGPPVQPAPDPMVVQWQADMSAAQKAAFSRQFEQGEKLYRKALQEAERLSPDPYTYYTLPATLQAFASFYGHQGKYPAAERLLRREIEVCEKRSGNRSFDAMNARRNLAMTYMMNRDYKSAEPIARELVDISEHYPPAGYDPLLPEWLDFLATIYSSQQQFEKAQPLLERALALDEKLQGPDSITMSVRLDHLAALYRSEGAFDKAEPLFRRELDLDELHNGKSSPAVLGALAQLVDLLKKMGRHEEAAQFQQRRDAIEKAQTHP